MTSIITVLVYIFFQGPAEGHLRVREFLATFGCCLLYGRVVVALTHSPFPFSILFVCSYFFLIFYIVKKVSMNFIKLKMEMDMAQIYQASKTKKNKCSAILTSKWTWER